LREVISEDRYFVLDGAPSQKARSLLQLGDRYVDVTYLQF